MTPPMNNYSRYSSNLPTIDSGAPEEPPAQHWDTETDHLLSYFLSDPNGQGAPPQASYQDFASTHPSSTEMNPPLGMTASYGPGSSRTSSNSTLTDAAEPPQPRTPAVQFYHPGVSHSTSHSSHSQQRSSHARQTAENIAAAAIPPLQAQSQLISSSSSSSLSSMAAALVSGAGPVLHHQIHQRQRSHTPTAPPTGNLPIHAGAVNQSTSNDSPPGHGQESPISPAAMIGNGQENLMLPPPSRRHNRHGATPTASTPTASSQPASKDPAAAQRVQRQPQRPYTSAQIVYRGPNQPKPEQQNNNHLDWLKHINARALEARNTPMNPPPPNQPTATMMTMPPPSVVAAHHSMAVSPAPGTTHVFHAGGFPAAAAAAVAQNPMLYQAALNHKFHMAAQSQGESEEKRARRLERNRESARKSRRRKKERLATLEAQVDRLHTQIEDERRNQVNAMCTTLKQVRRDEMAKLLNDVKENPDQLNTEAGKARLAAILHCSSGHSQIAQTTMVFQYGALKQVLLPRYQKFLLWLTLHPESFFIAGKEEYTRKDGKQVLRVSSGRVSSKQIGDELTNGWKTEKSDGRKKSKAETPDIAERANPTSRSLDAPRMWPLLCYELSISVDQEERLMQSLKRLQQMENLANYRSQLAAATKMTTSLTAAISSQGRSATAREDKSLLDVLTPAQTVKFNEWVAANQERCARVIRERRPAPEKCYPVFKETSLIEFCKRLDEVLRISQQEHEMHE